MLSEDTGDVFQILATDEAADALAAAKTPCQVTVDLRASVVRLADLTQGAVKGRAYRLRAISAIHGTKLQDGRKP